MIFFRKCPRCNPKHRYLHIQRGNTTLSKIKITFKEHILRCNKQTLYYTRDTETKVQFTKRLPHMGTCSGVKCAKINTNSLVEELDTANKYVSITYRTECCGGIRCLCRFPSSGCLFYRDCHVPVDDKILKVLQCPTRKGWHFLRRNDLETQIQHIQHRALTLC